MIKLIFNLFPISTNRLYCNIPGQKRRFISTEGKKFKQTIEDEVKKAINNEVTLLYLSSLLNKKLTVSINVISPSWLLKDGKTTAKKDIENTAKCLLDSIFDTFKISGIDLDDRAIWNLQLNKVVGETNITEVIIYELI